ncbi:MAG: metal-dependent transcriptional regulator [Spirochaetales bacterium]|nr:metal-dependent transcriptional regulator [Spirochaetales bacterium]
MAIFKKLSPSQEDYLESILELEISNRVARVKDIAEHLNVSMPSVTGALKQLKNKGLIDYEKNSYITLTDEGKNLAAKIFERHNSLDLFLREILLIEPERAKDEACKAEHAISQDTIRRLTKLSSFMKKRVLSEIKESEWEKILNIKRDSTNDTTV